MGKRKLKLPYFLSWNYNNTTVTSSSSSSSSSWPWPSCHQPKTVSFRRTTNASNNILKTINTAYVVEETAATSSTADESPSYSSEDESRIAESSIERVIEGIKSTESRLFFEPGETSSIIEEKPAKHEDVNDGGGGGGGGGGGSSGGFSFKESSVLSMESHDPYVDFRKSMEEMVEAHGLKEWEDLEELLCWYLKVNEKNNHGAIIAAFVHLLISISFASSTSTDGGGGSSNIIIRSNNDVINSSSSSSSSNCCFYNSREYSPSSPLSFYTSSCSSSDYSSSTPCVSSSLEIEEIDDSSPPPCLSSLLAIEESHHDEGL